MQIANLRAICTIYQAPNFQATPSIALVFRQLQTLHHTMQELSRDSEMLVYLLDAQQHFDGWLGLGTLVQVGVYVGLDPGSPGPVQEALEVPKASKGITGCALEDAFFTSYRQDQAEGGASNPPCHHLFMVTLAQGHSIAPQGPLQRSTKAPERLKRLDWKRHRLAKASEQHKVQCDIKEKKNYAAVKPIPISIEEKGIPRAVEPCNPDPLRQGKQ
eukprot:scaffold166686_cov13-Tisochrysis_lutea.AAC.1